MIKRIIRSKQFIHDCNKGFTLLELMVALIVASLILGFSLKFIVDQRKLFAEDQSRTQVNQNLRAAMDLVGTDIKQAGESIAVDTKLPVVQVINGGTSPAGDPLPDQLVLQRQVYDLNELPVCNTITAGTSTNTIDVSFNPANSVCRYSNSNADPLPDSLESWRDTRCSQDGINGCARTTNVANDGCVDQGGTDKECLWAYIYDPTNKVGEFFLYAFENSVSGTPTKYRIYRAQSATTSKNTWQNTYTYTAPTAANPNPTNPVVYILEERRYRLVNNPNSTGDKILELILNQQYDKSISLVNQLSNFQLTANAINNSTTPATVPAAQDQFPFTTGGFTYTWRNLQSINVNLTATNPSNGIINVSKRDLSAQFFPRNVSSQKQSN